MRKDHQGAGQKKKIRSHGKKRPKIGKYKKKEKQVDADIVNQSNEISNDPNISPITIAPALKSDKDLDADNGEIILYDIGNRKICETPSERPSSNERESAEFAESDSENDTESAHNSSNDENSDHDSHSQQNT